MQWDNTAPNEYPRYDTKHPDDKVPVMLELWGISPLYFYNNNSFIYWT